MHATPFFRLDYNAMYLFVLCCMLFLLGILLCARHCACRFVISLCLHTFLLFLASFPLSHLLWFSGFSHPLPVTPHSHICHPTLPHLSPHTPTSVTPHSHICHPTLQHLSPHTPTSVLHESFHMVSLFL